MEDNMSIKYIFMMTLLCLIHLVYTNCGPKPKINNEFDQLIKSVNSDSTFLRSVGKGESSSAKLAKDKAIGNARDGIYRQVWKLIGTDNDECLHQKGISYAKWPRELTKMQEIIATSAFKRSRIIELKCSDPDKKGIVCCVAVAEIPR